jgi:hypothetical protein
VSPVLYASAEYRAGGRNALHVSADAIVLTNVGTIIHSAYVFHLPAGPVWALHTFYLVTMALMPTWYLRYARHAKSGCTGRPTPREHEEMAGSPDSPVPSALWPPGRRQWAPAGRGALSDHVHAADHPGNRLAPQG